MRLETLITVSLDATMAELLTEAVEDLLPGASFEPGRYQVRFHHASESLVTLIGILRHLGIPYDSDEARAFSDTELHNAPMLRIVPPEDLVVVHRKASNDDPPCGHAVGPITSGGSLYLPKTEVGNLFRQTTNGGCLLDEELASAFIKEHIHGGLLRPVSDTTGAMSPYFVLIPQHRLPPMQVPPTRVKVNPDAACPHCGQGGMSLRSLPFYGADLESFDDVNITYEQFRHGEEVAPEIVISQRVFRLLEKHSVGKIAVEPVMLV